MTTNEPTNHPPIASLESLLWPISEDRSDYWVYAVLDGAQNRSIASTLFDSFARYECLYEGELTSEMRAVAPYLIRLRQGTPYTQWLFDNVPANNWGIFIKSTANFKELRRHLRRFLRVKSEEGKTLLFRWYDPRVMRAYLPTCTEEELNFIFGPMSHIITESETNYTFHEFSIESTELSCETVETDTHALVQ
ncbi:MAG: DUF4123 domain-containing protein [Fibrobacterales bacterium]